MLGLALSFVKVDYYSGDYCLHILNRSKRFMCKHMHMNYTLNFAFKHWSPFMFLLQATFKELIKKTFSRVA